MKIQPNTSVAQSSQNVDHANLDRLLEAHLASPDELLTPSSGFVLSVMSTIQQETASPPPIGFPWRRVLPGAAAVLCMLATLLVFLARSSRTALAGQFAVPSTQISQPLSLSAITPTELALFATLSAAALSAITVAAALRLTSEKP